MDSTSDGLNKALTGLNIVGGLIVLFLIYKLFRKMGLIKSDAELKEQNQAHDILTSAYFSPLYYQEQIKFVKKKGNSVTTRKMFPNVVHFTDYAKRIWDSKGFFKDNESQAIGVMKSMISKSEVSLFADYFQKQYKRDLVNFMQTYMNDQQLSIIYSATINLKTI